jgi:hypothetical protein
MLLFFSNPSVDRLNSSTASTKILLILTKMLAPSSTGCVGSLYTSTVVERPPM